MSNIVDCLEVECVNQCLTKFYQAEFVSFESVDYDYWT